MNLCISCSQNAIHVSDVMSVVMRPRNVLLFRYNRWNTDDLWLAECGVACAGRGPVTTLITRLAPFGMKLQNSIRQIFGNTKSMHQTTVRNVLYFKRYKNIISYDRLSITTTVRSRGRGGGGAARPHSLTHPPRKQTNSDHSTFC